MTFGSERRSVTKQYDLTSESPFVWYGIVEDVIDNSVRLDIDVAEQP